MMGLSLVTKPTVEPVTLIEAKAHCRIDTSDDDGLLAGYIMTARAWLESQVGPLMTQTWDTTFDYRWPWYDDRYVLRLPLRPVQSVTSVTYVDESGATQTLSPSLYTVVLNTPVATVEKAYNALWPNVRRQIAAIAVRGVYGYGSNPGDVPAPLRHALLMLVGHFNEHREAVVIGQAPASVPMSVEMLISPYRDGSF
jgi:uncharacterized phiE125 gp8 family phage protein